MFLPKTHTRWKGNLKKLVMKNNQIVDMDDNPGLDSEGGVIAKDATTFWSEPGSLDGNKTHEGGVNYQLSKQSTRKIYSDYGKGKFFEFTHDEAIKHYSKKALADKLGGSQSESESIIKWTRGEDVMETNPNGPRRLDIFGDPLHSKPVTMDFGNKGVRIFIGTNAGVLHAFHDKGNTVKESWAFIPDSLFKILKPFKDAKPDTKLYGMDGPMSIFFKDVNRDGKVNGNDKVWLFVGMRRGGDRYYGIDITNPDVPKLMWGGAISPSRKGFEELGQTWSKPVATYIRKQKDKPVLIFAAGYDTNKDNVFRTNDKKGRGLFIVDAEFGNLVWSLTHDGKGVGKFKGDHSIAADLSLVDSDYDGFTDRIYAADTAGSIWRVDMPKDSPTDENEPWTHFEFAQFGSGDNSANDRRFFYKPLVGRSYYSKVTEEVINGVSVFKRRDTPYDAILIGSGNRSKPLGKYVKDYLFMIRDENTITRSFNNPPDPIKVGDLLEVNDEAIFHARNDKVKFQKEEAKLSKKEGWRYSLSNGEKSLSPVSVFGGVAYYTTFLPDGNGDENQCSLSGGSGALYAFHMHLGARVYKNLKEPTARDLSEGPVLFFDDDTVLIKDDKTDDEPPQLPPRPGVVGEFISDQKLGIRTRQMYIYKREEHDEK
jgi:type IV pilus assembly protein PilY1